MNAVMTSTVTWNDAATPPDVPQGGIGYFLVVTEASGGGFGAHYLNGYRLNYEDGCPDAEELAGVSCKFCDDGDGHPCVGWFEEKTRDYDDDLYYPMIAEGPHSVKLWARPPANPLMRIPTTTGDTPS
jgi:hypothetical protein